MGVVYLTYWRRKKPLGGRISRVCPAGRNGEPLTRLPSLRSPGFQLGPDCNLNHTVAPFSEDLIGVVDLIEREAVRQQRGQI
jgi:hypothetical protein